MSASSFFTRQMRSIASWPSCQLITPDTRRTRSRKANTSGSAAGLSAILWMSFSRSSTASCLASAKARPSPSASPLAISAASASRRCVSASRPIFCCCSRTTGNRSAKALRRVASMSLKTTSLSRHSSRLRCRKRRLAPSSPGTVLRQDRAPAGAVRQAGWAGRGCPELALHLVARLAEFCCSMRLLESDRLDRFLEGRCSRARTPRSRLRSALERLAVRAELGVGVGHGDLRFGIARRRRRRAGPARPRAREGASRVLRRTRRPAGNHRQRLARLQPLQAHALEVDRVLSSAGSPTAPKSRARRWHGRAGCETPRLPPTLPTA